MEYCRECKVSKKNASATAHSENIGEHASLNGNKPQNEHMGLHNAKKTSTLTFDDVICSDRSSQLGRRFADALGITTPLLDELIDKVHLVSRLDTLEKRMNDKVLKSTFNALEKDLKLKLNTKVEHEEFTYSMSKKASVTEMQQFRENLYKQIDVIRNTLSNSVIQGGSVAGMVAASVGKSDGNGSNIDEKTLHALALERAETLERFDLLYKQFNDLTLHCEKFVPRDEVEKALHAIVVQVKSLKINSVELPVMKEALKQKADASDVKALVSALEQSIGEIAGSSAGAIHQKCLLCDKTVSRVTPVESIPSVADRMGEMEERLNSPPTNQGSPAKRPLSPSTANQRKAAAKMKMNSDLTVLRCSVDLPPLRSVSDRILAMFPIDYVFMMQVFLLYMWL